jgi:hypothetical protein
MKKLGDLISGQQQRYHTQRAVLNDIKLRIEDTTSVAVSSVAIKDGQLTIAVDNSTEAGELRLRQPELLAGLKDLEVVSIKVVVKA